MSDSSPSAPTTSSRVDRTGPTNASNTFLNPVHYLVASFKRTGSIWSGMLLRSSLPDEERAITADYIDEQAHPPTSADFNRLGTASLAESEERTTRSCPVLFLIAVPWMLLVLVFFSIISIAAVASASFLLSIVGVTLLGFTRVSGGVYTDLAVVSLIVATFSGAAVITATCAALMLVFLPLSMCCGDDVLISLASTIAVFGGIVATFFAPAIGIAVTNGRIIGLSSAFGATEAMRMNGAGLGGVLACVLAELILGGIAACLQTPVMW